MGSAAYRRGSEAIRHQLAAEGRPQAFAFMDALNALPKYADAGRPCGAVELVWDRGVWWITCPRTGFGYWYPTLREAIRRWDITVTGYEQGRWQAVPTPHGSHPTRAGA